MLVLTRRPDEEIVIDGRIRVKVLRQTRGKVSLGITAPDDIRIEREEALGAEGGSRLTAGAPSAVAQKATGVLASAER